MKRPHAKVTERRKLTTVESCRSRRSGPECPTDPVIGGRVSTFRRAEPFDNPGCGTAGKRPSVVSTMLPHVVPTTCLGYLARRRWLIGAEPSQRNPWSTATNRMTSI